ncbi:MAG: hypothetical protein ACOZAA_02500 [Pseudomonadota bacterium]
MRYLVGDLESLVTDLQIRQGRKFSLEDEARLLHGLSIDRVSEDELRRLRAALDAALPGEGPLAERYRDYDERVRAPAERVEGAIRASVAACERQTRLRLNVPEDRGATIVFDPDTYLQGQMNYRGGFSGDLVFWTHPMSAMRILSLSCHEGYPGHYLHFLLRERSAVERGFVEAFTQPFRAGVVLEGVAEFAYQAVFTPEEQARVLAEEVLPAAGLDPSLAEMHVRVWHADEALKQAAATEAGRRLLSGEMSRAEAEAWFAEAGVVTPSSVKGWLDFVEADGAYALLYGPGEARVRRRIEAAGGTVDNPTRRWEAYLQLLMDPWPQPEDITSP